MLSKALRTPRGSRRVARYLFTRLRLQFTTATPDIVHDHQALALLRLGPDHILQYAVLLVLHTPKDL